MTVITILASLLLVFVIITNDRERD